MRQNALTDKSFSMKTFLQLFRVQYSIPFTILYVFTLYYIQPAAFRVPLLSISIFSSLAVALLLAFAYSHNEVCDVEIDRRTPARHPIADGRIGIGLARLLAWSAGIASFGFAIASRHLPFIVAFTVVFAALIFYNRCSKRIGLVKQWLAPALFVCIYPLCFAAVGMPVGPRAWSLAVLPVWLYMTGVGFELIKDLIDRKTDPCSPLKGRPAMWREVASYLIAGNSPLLLLPILLGCKWIYAAGAIAAITVAFRIFWVNLDRAMRVVYLECSIVGIAVALDLLLLGH